MAAEKIQELTENFYSLVTTKHHEKENNCSDINLEMAAMRTLIEQLQSTPAPPPKNCLCKPFVDQGSYCWTNGYAVTKSHSSQNCRTNGPGHKEEATRENNMEEVNTANHNFENSGRSDYTAITL
jgi:hypothetical protein